MIFRAGCTYGLFVTLKLAGYAIIALCICIHTLSAPFFGKNYPVTVHQVFAVAPTVDARLQSLLFSDWAEKGALSASLAIRPKTAFGTTAGFAYIHIAGSVLSDRTWLAL